MPWTHPTENNPESIVIVGLGPSKQDWINTMLTKGMGNLPALRPEVWTVNRGIRSLRHDLAFVMDDLELEAEADPHYAYYLATAEKPIITSTAYDDYPAAVEYPLTEIMRFYRREHYYWHNSIPYALAYAGFIGVREITIYGCDYTHPTHSGREDDRANAEYWIGVLRERGIRVGVVSTSTLLNSNRGDYLYGYRSPPPRAELERRVAELPAIELEETVEADTVVEYTQRPCPHGKVGECGECDVEGDFEYDRQREARLFRQR